MLLGAGVPLLALGIWVGASLADPLGPHLSVDDVTLAEGDLGNTDFVFTVRLSEALTTSVKVTYSTANGTATAGSDYNRARGSVSFAPGETSKTVAVTVRGDTEAEPDETFFVNLSAPKGAVIDDGQGLGTILNDDASGLSINDVTVAEGDSGATMATFTVGLSSPLAADADPVVFDIATASGTATAGEDYIAKSLTDEQIPPGGQFYAFSVEVNGDEVFEQNETFRVDISDVSGSSVVDAQGIGTIANDDPEAEPALSIDGRSVAEGDSGTTEVELTVSLSPASTKRVNVLYATADGTATAGSDYQPTNGRLVFARGETSKTVTVVVNGDTDDEPDEDFVVNLTDASNAFIVQGQALVTILNDDNTLPVAEADTVGTIEDTPVAITLSATDAEADELAFSIASGSGPDHGTLGALEPADCSTTPGTCTAEVTYTPEANFHGQDAFDFVANDGHGDSIPATITITVTPVNDPPVAIDDVFTTNEDTSLVLPDSGIGSPTANDSDVDGDTLTVVDVNTPVGGSVNLTAGEITFAPTPGLCGAGVGGFDYETSDGAGGSDIGQVTIDITCVDDAPVAADDAATVVEDSDANAIDVLANDADADGGPKAVASVVQPTNGAVAIIGGGTGVSYSPDPNYCNSPPGTSSDTFTYTLSPGGSTATVSVTVTCVDDAPVAVDDTATLTEDDSATTIQALANDTDVDGGPIAIQSVTQPANGTVVITNGGADLTYEPDADYCNDPPLALDTFTYTLSPGGSTATVSVSVICVAEDATITNSAGPLAYTENDPPTAIDAGVAIANPDGVTITGASVSITTGFLAQDALDWVDNDTTDGIIEGASTAQTVLLTGNGTAAEYAAALAAVTYVNTSENPSTLTRTVTFDIAGPSSDTIDITVTAVDDAPVAVDDGATVVEDSGANTIDVLANDTDVDGGPKTVASVTQPANGTVVVTNAGADLTYAPDADYCNSPPGTSSDAFTYTLTPGGSTATVSMSVTCVNDAPLVTGESYDTIGNTVLRVDHAAGTPGQVHVTGDVLANDTDVEGDALTASIANPATDVSTGAVVFMETDGEFTYTPPAGATGTDMFTYTVSDGNGGVSTGVVTVTLKGMVWYVDNSTGSGGSGRSADPFDTLAEAETASSAGNTIYVDGGDGTSTGQGSGITLKADQRLLGEAVALSVPVAVNGGPDPTVLRGAGSRPVIGNAAGNGISAAAGVEIRGLDIAGSVDGIDVTVATGAPTVVIQDNVVRSAAIHAVDINVSSPAAVMLALARNAVTATGNAIDIAVASGATTTVREFTDNSVAGATAGSGIVANAVGTLAFDASADAGIQAVSGGVTTVGSSGDPVGGGGLLLPGVTGALQFTDLDVFAGGGTALWATGVGSGLTFGAGAPGGPSATLSAVGGPALTLSGAMTLPDAMITSTSSPTHGISLTNVTGTLSTTVGSSITNAAGPALAISGGSATIAYPGTITNSVGRSIDIQNRTGGTVALSGTTSDTGAGIFLNANTGSAINLSGALTLSTGSNPAFTATGGGTVTATNTTNTIATTTGTALNVANTTIGTGGLRFRSISSNGAARGIVLNTTGSTAGLTVGGTGTAGSGGTIQNSTANAAVSDAGIQLINTRDVSLASMNVTGNQGNGIYGSNVTNLALTGLTVSGNTTSGNAATNDHAGLRFDNLLGTATWTSLTVASHAEDNARVLNTSGTLSQLTITDSTFRDTATVDPGNNGLLIQANGTGNITADVTGSSFLRNRANGVQVVTNDAGTIDVEIGSATASSGGTFTDNNIGVNIAHNSSGTMRFNVTNATFSTPGLSGAASAINLNRGSGAGSVARGLMQGNVTGNVITNNNSMVGAGIRAIANGGDTSGASSNTMRLLIAHNTISQVANFGIHVHARDGNATIDANILNNTVTTSTPAALEAIRVDAGATSANVLGQVDNGVVNAHISGNRATTDPAAGLTAIRVRQRFNTTYRLQGYTGAATDNAAVQAFLANQNTNAANTGPATVAADHNASATPNPGFLFISDVQDPIP